MATNWNTPSREYQSREDVYEDERRDEERKKEYEDVNLRTNRYLKNHPSASYAKAKYKTRSKQYF